MTEISVRKTIYDVCAIKISVLALYEDMCGIDKKIQDQMNSINDYGFYDLRYKGDAHGENYVVQEVDRKCWRYLIKLYQLEKYMLCTEYEKLRKQIDIFDFPEFTIDNAEQWLLSLKSLVYESIQKLIEDVFNRITKETYYTGSGFTNRLKKKRNNNGIDKHFIITTHDNYNIAWYIGRPTITDDLEKACYIIDGKSLPEITIKNMMQKGKIWESENDYFKIRICFNGNTHYWIKDDIRSKLNFYGSKRGVIGENIKIKVFEKD